MEILEGTRAEAPETARAGATRRALLACGIAYVVVYVVTNDLVAALSYEGYSRMDQAVSELSAISAPPRTFLMAMLPLYTALMIAFGVGVWQSASGSRALRLTAAALVAFGVTGVVWLPFPMSPREDIVASSTMSVNDVGHLVLSGLTALLIVAMCVAAAAHFGLWFRVYTAATLVVVLLFSGVLTGVQSAKLPDGDPTPLLGFYERVGMGAWLLWIAVLAVMLLSPKPHDQTGSRRDLSRAR
jgi:hypothetical protein